MKKIFFHQIKKNADRYNCPTVIGYIQKKLHLGTKLLLLAITMSIISVLVTSCKKGVQVGPPVTQIDGSVAYKTDVNATSVLTGIYMSMAQGGIFEGVTSLTTYGGLSSDELATNPGLNFSLNLAYQNAFLPTTTPVLWSNLYLYVYKANSAIAGINSSTTLSPTVRKQLLGEAKFLRALYYFYLVNYYGDVPLLTTTDFTSNSQMSRTSQSVVYNQIIQDLKDSQGLLSTNFLVSDLKTTSTERTRPTYWAATALLARVYLYTKDYPNAETQATILINDNSQFSLVDSSKVFLKNNQEAIWQLQPVTPGVNTYDAAGFVLTGAPNGVKPMFLSNQLLSSFEPGDRRRTNWVGNITIGVKTYYFPFKYKNYLFNASNPAPTEYLNVLRLAEQYLIRAEASAQGGSRGLTGAIADLNTIRNRAGLSPVSATVPATVLTAIYHERQIEFFAEMGHRWFDLKRTGAVDAVMGGTSGVTSLKGGTWSSYKAFFPIPIAELQHDPALVQTPGY